MNFTVGLLQWPLNYFAPQTNYISGSTAFEIANDVFGFNGWSRMIKSMTIGEGSGRVKLLRY